MDDNSALKDVWMLDINSGMWKEVGREFKSQLASGVMIKTWLFSLSFDHTKVITFTEKCLLFSI